MGTYLLVTTLARNSTSHCDTEFLGKGTSPAFHLIYAHLQLVATRVGHVQGVQTKLDIVLILSLVSDGDMGAVGAVPVMIIATQIAADEQCLRISIIVDSVQVHFSHTLLQSTVAFMVVLQASIKFHTALPLQVCGASAFLAGWLIRTGLELRAACGMLIC